MMLQGIRSAMHTRDRYEDPVARAKALATMPVAEMYSKLNISQANPSDEDKDKLLMELMRWFKEDFFTWVNNPPCPGCGSIDKVEGERTDAALYHEKMHGATVAEVYSCIGCNCEFRYPRFNSASHLLETRSGRCGEWANCFCLCAVSLGFEVRYIRDFTDHVWAEVYSGRLDKWIHCDSCEGPSTIDSPLMYEQGWGKKLSYIIAVGADHVVDVTQKYTRDFNDVLQRRLMLREDELREIVKDCDRIQRQKRFGSRFTHDRLVKEQLDIFYSFESDLHLKESEIQGRISGDKTWKRLRGEDGK